MVVFGSGSYCWFGRYNSWIYVTVTQRIFVLCRCNVRKLLLATVCFIVLTVGAQAKPVRLGLIDNRWVIEYESELFAGACIANDEIRPFKTEDSLLLPLIHRKGKGQKNFGSSVLLVRSGLGLRAAQLI